MTVQEFTHKQAEWTQILGSWYTTKVNGTSYSLFIDWSNASDPATATARVVNNGNEIGLGWVNSDTDAMHAAEEYVYHGLMFGRKI